MERNSSVAAKVRAVALALAGMLVAISASAGSQTLCPPMAAAMPDGWVTVGIGKAFCLSLPSTLRRKPVRSKDSLSGEFESAELHLMFDYGPYSSPLTEFASQQPRVESIVVDGHNAKLVSTPGMTAVHVPAAGARHALTVIVRYGDEGSQPRALQIVQAIRFAATN